MPPPNRCLVLVLWASLTAADAGESPPNQLLDQLIQEGIPIGALSVPLPSPTFAGGAQPEYRDIVTQVAGRHGWVPFVRDSIVAPFALKLNFVKDANGQRVGHTIDVWFVAHGSLATLQDADWFGDLMGLDADESQDAGAEIDGDVLRQVGIRQATGVIEQFIRMDFPVLKRVRVQGVGRIVDSSSERTLVVAWELDRRFDGHPDFSNVWRSVDADDTGRRRLGPPHAYQGYGGYAKITPLPKPAGALFVETHVVLHEPRAWFSGDNFLRSKLPLVMQETVRKFRRALKKREQERATAATSIGGK